MSNMSYCRFQNTAADLHDCVANLRSLNPADIGYNADRERVSRRQIIELAATLLQSLDGFEVDIDEMALEMAIDALDDEFDGEDEEC